MKDEITTIFQLKERIKKFVQDRDWEQYHSPKNLAMSLAIEVGELMEHFQWSSVEEAKESLKKKRNKQEIEKELADILIYVLEFAQLYDIDLTAAINKKININAKKYPVHLAKGKAHKYTYYKKPR